MELPNIDGTGKGKEVQINQALIEVKNYETAKRDSLKKVSSEEYAQKKKFDDEKEKDNPQIPQSGETSHLGVLDYLVIAGRFFHEKVWNNVADENKMCCVCSSCCCCFIFILLFYSFFIKG